MKYTKELLEQHIQDTFSFAELARKLGIAPVGGNTTHLVRMCQKFELDTSHFLGSAHNTGRPARNRYTPEQVLQIRPKTKGRETVKRLRRAMLEAGIEYKCHCGNDGTWQGKILPLQIDHIDGRYWNNNKDNLRFICPNCHVQTDTHGAKNIGRGP